MGGGVREGLGVEKGGRGKGGGREGGEEPRYNDVKMNYMK